MCFFKSEDRYCGARCTLTAKESIFGLADSNRENIMIRGIRIAVWLKNVKCYGGMPILLSSDGWALLLNTTYKTEFDIGATSPDEIFVRYSYDYVDIYLFRADSLLGLTKFLTLVSGRPLYHRWQLAFKKGSQLQNSTIKLESK